MLKRFIGENLEIAGFWALHIHRQSASFGARSNSLISIWFRNCFILIFRGRPTKLIWVSSQNVCLRLEWISYWQLGMMGRVPKDLVLAWSWCAQALCSLTRSLMKDPCLSIYIYNYIYNCHLIWDDFGVPPFWDTSITV